MVVTKGGNPPVRLFPILSDSFQTNWTE